jgi:hypothetical protein
VEAGVCTTVTRLAAAAPGALNAQQQHRQCAGQTQHQQQQVFAGLAANTTVVTEALAVVSDLQPVACKQ